MVLQMQEKTRRKAFLQDFREIILDLKEYLNYQKDTGLEGFYRVSVGAVNTQNRIIPLQSHHEEFHDDRRDTLETIRNQLGDCRRCRLYSDRNNIVFGEGNENADLMFVGEAPGRDEDIKGEPFVGKAGQLLTKIINAIDLSRKDVYIANIIKCRPPTNRNPEQDEIASCEPFLIRQIDVIKPRIICALGTIAAQTLLQSNQKISDLRGRFHDYRGRKLIPTYHPAFLLRNPYFKRHVWEDMQLIEKEYRK